MSTPEHPILPREWTDRLTLDQFPSDTPPAIIAVYYESAWNKLTQEQQREQMISMTREFIESTEVTKTVKRQNRQYDWERPRDWEGTDDEWELVQQHLELQRQERIQEKFEAYKLQLQENALKRQTPS